MPSTDTASRWPELAEAAHRSGAEWAAQLTAAAPAVALIADLSTSAGYLPDQEVVTHADVDQKNLVATASGPVLCDWDLTAPLVPRRELADVAMSLGCWAAFNVERAIGLRAATAAETVLARKLAPQLLAAIPPSRRSDHARQRHPEAVMGSCGLVVGAVRRHDLRTLLLCRRRATVEEQAE